MKKILLFGVPVVALVGLLWYHAATTDFEALEADRPLLVEGDSGEAVITVNGEPVSEAQFGAAVNSLDQMQQAAVASEAGRRAVADQLVRQKLLAQEARRRGLASKQSVRGQIEMAIDQILAENAIREIILDDTYMSEEELLESLSRDLEVAAVSQIVLEGEGEETLAQARRILALIEDGASFEEMVAQHSVAPENGGDIGEVTRNLLLPDVADAVFSTQEGGVSEPVRIGDAYHIFHVRERRLPDEERLREEIERNPQGTRARAALQRLRESADVELNEEWLRKPGQ